MAKSQTYSTADIIQALQDTNGLVSLAARKLGCVPQTIYTRMHTVQSVRQAVDDCRDNLIDQAELALRSAVLNKEPWAVALVLKTIGKKRGYVERQEITGADGEPQKVLVEYVNREADPTRISSEPADGS